jgi:hypothetical protein
VQLVITLLLDLRLVACVLLVDGELLQECKVQAAQVFVLMANTQQLDPLLVLTALQVHGVFEEVCGMHP